MRTLTSLRASCQDELLTHTFTNNDNADTEYPGDFESSPLTYTPSVSKGFYLINGTVEFAFKQSTTVFAKSKVHESFMLEYKDSAGNTIQTPIDNTNSFLTSDADVNWLGAKWNVNKPVYIKENSGDFVLKMVASEFDGNQKEVDFTQSQTYTSFGWRDNFVWSDFMLMNTNTTTDEVIETSLTPHKLGDTFTVADDKTGTMLNVQVQFQCWSDAANVDAGLVIGPLYTSASIGACHLFLKKDGVEVNRSSIGSSLTSDGIWKTQLTLSGVLEPGSYELFASGCGYYNGTGKAHAGNKKGIVNLLISHTLGQTKLAQNTDTATSYMTLAEPTITLVNGIAAGKFLEEDVASGVENLPVYKLKTASNSLTLQKIF